MEIGRIAYSADLFTVQAENEKEAKELALEKAKDHYFENEYDSEYVVAYVSLDNLT